MVTDDFPTRDPILVYIARTLESSKTKLEAELARVTAAEELVKKIDHPQALRYRVSLMSMWSNEGEESVTITRRGPLSAVLRFAMTKFKRVNRRSDIQATWSVYALVPAADQKSTLVPVPESFWKHIKEEK